MSVKLFFIFELFKTLLIFQINWFFYYVFKFMKKHVYLKPSQEYTNVSITKYNTILLINKAF